LAPTDSLPQRPGFAYNGRMTQMNGPCGAQRVHGALRMARHVLVSVQHTNRSSHMQSRRHGARLTHRG
jgi:hypothetical protein